MTQAEGYKSAWANGSLFEGIAEDFLALLDAHDPQTDRLKAAFLIRKNIGADGISLGVFDAWANQDSANQIPVESLQAEWDATETMTQADAESWLPPLPIPETLRSVEPFNYALLPDALRPWITDIAERMQCPPDFPAVGSMVALSSVIGRKACIFPKRKDDWRVIPNLWGMIVGRPAAMKSPALSEVMKPLDRLEATASLQHTELMRDFQINHSMAEMSAKVAEKDIKTAIKNRNEETARYLLEQLQDGKDIQEPPLRRYRVNDTTMEALGETLMDNPTGVLVYRDELHGLLKSMDKEGQEGARAFYLQGYDGNQPYVFDRIGRGRNRRIEAVCLSMLGGIQPGKLQAYIRDAVRGGAGDDGLLQRFGLLVWPDDSREWSNIDRWPESAARTKAFDVFTQLDALEPDTNPDNGEIIPKEYRFTEEAQVLFEGWREDLELMLRSRELHPALESHLGKYRKLIPALALVCALADGEQAVSHNSLLKALGWYDYLKSHAERAYAAGSRPATEGAAALLARIKSGSIKSGFSPRDVYLKGWSRLTTKEDVQAAAALLCDLHHLREIEHTPGRQGGRPTVNYEINPLTLAGC
jgi:putative DNA primase/helicase